MDNSGEDGWNWLGSGSPSGESHPSSLADGDFDCDLIMLGSPVPESLSENFPDAGGCLDHSCQMP